MAGEKYAKYLLLWDVWTEWELLFEEDLAAETRVGLVLKLASRFIAAAWRSKASRKGRESCWWGKWRSHGRLRVDALRWCVLIIIYWLIQTGKRETLVFDVFTYFQDNFLANVVCLIKTKVFSSLDGIITKSGQNYMLRGKQEWTCCLGCPSVSNLVINENNLSELTDFRFCDDCVNCFALIVVFPLSTHRHAHTKKKIALMLNDPVW